jgi:putative membrane protein
MAFVAWLLTGLVVAIHIYVVILEMVLWKARGPKVFGITPAFAAESSRMASNQGLYNGFLVVAIGVGSVWRAAGGNALLVFGLACVAVAGLWGGLTVGRRILLVQSVPAAAALAAHVIAGTLH